MTRDRLPPPPMPSGWTPTEVWSRYPRGPAAPPLPEYSTDATGVLTGNTDLDGSSQWQPPAAEPERAPLPGHEHQLDPEAKVWPWLTERRADIVSLVLAAIAIALRLGTLS